MKHLQLQYKLDYPEMSDRPSGTILMVVVDTNNNGHVEAVLTTKCTLEAVREDLTALCELGDIFVPANDTDLFNYEFVHATMEQELTEINAKLAAEDAQYELERNRKTAKKVLDMLSSQSFDDFYRGPHMDYIEGEQGCKTEEEMLAIIVTKFVKKF